MLMMDQDPPGLEKKIREGDYKIVKKRKGMRMIVRNKGGEIDGLETIFEED